MAEQTKSVTAATGPPMPPVTSAIPVAKAGPHITGATLKNSARWSGLGVDVSVDFSRQFEGPVVTQDAEILRVACTTAVLHKQGKKLRDPMVMAESVMDALDAVNRERVLEIRLSRFQEEGHGVVIQF